MRERQHDHGFSRECERGGTIAGLAASARETARSRVIASRSNKSFYWHFTHRRRGFEADPTQCGVARTPGKSNLEFFLCRIRVENASPLPSHDATPTRRWIRARLGSVEFGTDRLRGRRPAHLSQNGRPQAFSGLVANNSQVFTSLACFMNFSGRKSLGAARSGLKDHFWVWALSFFAPEKPWARARCMREWKDVLVINLYIIQLKRVLQKSYWNEHNKEKIKTYLIRLIIN